MMSTPAHRQVCSTLSFRCPGQARLSLFRVVCAVAVTVSTAATTRPAAICLLAGLQERSWIRACVAIFERTLALAPVFTRPLWGSLSWMRFRCVTHASLTTGCPMKRTPRISDTVWNQGPPPWKTRGTCRCETRSRGCQYLQASATIKPDYTHVPEPEESCHFPCRKVLTCLSRTVVVLVVRSLQSITAWRSGNLER